MKYINAINLASDEKWNHFAFKIKMKTFIYFQQGLFKLLQNIYNILIEEKYISLDRFWFRERFSSRNYR